MSTGTPSVAAVFREVFELGPDQSVEDLEYRGIEEWDSVAHMSLVAALEERFDVMFDTDQVIDMSSYQKAVEILAELGAGVD